ncbi:MBG domain-containing protein [Arcobacter sp. YIC-310]|uniref:MBG domain-containing protein n=1 Tax=Arcobacter sp. YIC-310 TaxID=3376632 RepID=UPI003C22A71F
MKRLFDFSSRFRILKGGKISLVVSAMISSTTLSFAAPSGGVVTSGNASISQSGNITNIVQDSQKASINWKDFSINKDEIVNFKQPNVNSITLNRVIGNEKSVINGALNANGQVWILNSNGVLFGKNAKINTSGLLATTKELSDQDFQAGNFTFKGDSNQSVINLGEIDISDSGYATLLANSVSNEGVIKAIKGSVRLVGAKEVTINFNGNSLVDLTVNKGVLDSLVENKGAVYADGGEIYFTTNAVNELLKGVVNNEGIAEANSLDGITGYIEMFAHGGEAKISGEITAKDGFVETSAKKVDIDSDTKVKADKWLIDPTNITINDSTAYETSLNSGTDVEIQTDSNGNDEGNIYVEDEITWDSESKLTLNAHNDIFINKSITATNENGKLALHYGQGGQNADNTSKYYIGKNGKVNLSAGQNFFTKLGNDVSQTEWIVITLDNLATAIGNGGLSSNYTLGSDLDLSFIPNWVPIGSQDTRFTGKFDGLGHTISNLNIDREGDSNIGFFGYLDNAVVRNIALTNANISGNSNVGILVGSAYNSNILEQVYTSGTIKAKMSILGGIAGILSSNSTLKNSYSEASVSGEKNFVGGLVGINQGTIINSYFNGTVSGGSYTTSATIEDDSLPCSQYPNSCGDKIYYSKVGGLIGSNLGTINNSFYNSTKESEGNSMYAKTEEELQNKNTFYNWDKNIWGLGKDIEGYGIGVFPFLKGIISLEDITVSSKLFESGFGTEDNPYAITDWKQLFNINHGGVLSENYYFSLLNDLNNKTSYYSDLASQNANDGKGWAIIGSTSLFTGTFDGKGHTIDNLYINRPDEAMVGLFRMVDSSNIRNVGLTNAYVKGDQITGGLIGHSINSTTENVFVEGTIEGGMGVGGIIGFLEKRIESDDDYNVVTLKNSYSKGVVKGNDYVGGLVGAMKNERILTSFSEAKVETESENRGGIVGAQILTDGDEGENKNILQDVFYNKELNPGMNDEEAFGKTTKELQKVGTFTNWNIVEDKTLGKVAPKLSWQFDEDGKYQTVWVVGKGITTLNYNLQNLQKEYKGSDYLLNNLYLAQSIFGQDGAGLVLGEDYQFIKGESVVTSFKNAGTYDGISIKLLNNEDFELGIDNTNGKLIITPKAITVSANDLEKVYGQNDSELTYKTDGLVGNDTLAGSLVRQSGENVGAYTISQGSLANSNYTITFENGTYKITPKAITVSANDLEKVYGQKDAQLTYKTDGLVGNDTLAGSLVRQSGENVGAYTISQGSLANSNYTITFENGTYKITPKAITVSANDLEKVYGQKDAQLTYKTDGLVGNDTLAGSLVRQSGENVGAYTISQGSLANSNYTITFENGTYKITPKAITVSANDLEKVYGQKDAQLTYKTDGLVGDDTLAGSLVRQSGENVGNYTISQGSLANSNYTITFENGTYKITPKAITVSANDLEKVYGQKDAQLTYKTDGLVGDDTLAGSLVRQSGENVGNYTISQGSLANSNYTITFENGTYKITPKAITVSANDLEKVVGKLDPELSYIVKGLLEGDTLKGKLIREKGQDIGVYEISLGNLSNKNYKIDFNSGKLIIKRDKTLDKVVTVIENKKVVKLDSNIQVVKTVKPVVNNSLNNRLVSKPIEGQATKRVTLSQAKQMQQDATGQNVEEVKVPLSRSSIIELVDGGVLLPVDVEQEFYIADEI